MITVIAIPAISSIAPTSGPVGSTVTITGTNFSATPDNNTVRFGATQATVTAATTTQLTVSVPAGATYAPITVKVADRTAYSVASFLTTFAPGKQTIATSDFDPKVDFTSGSSPRGIAAGDLDGDGKTDIVVVNFSAPITSLYIAISQQADL